MVLLQLIRRGLICIIRRDARVDSHPLDRFRFVKVFPRLCRNDIQDVFTDTLVSFADPLFYKFLIISFHVRTSCDNENNIISVFTQCPIG